MSCCTGGLGAVQHNREGATTSEAREGRPTVVLVGTLDTKGHEYAFLRDRVRERGVDVLPSTRGSSASR